MMPNLTTPVIAKQTPFKLDFASGVVSMGSCFADEMGQRMQECDFHIECNPFGALYNPASLASALHRLIDDNPIGKEDLVKHEGLWHSWHHHGSFSHSTPGATLTVCNSRIHRAHEVLKEATLLMVTFGTAWVFEHEGAVVANCHKLPPQQFTRRRMSVEEIVALWQPLLQELIAYYPRLHIILSVSPIRHMADGAHGNQLSKSTLLLAVDQLVTQAERLSNGQAVVYFPSYEIVLDELRDYRYFDEKMTHPTPLAVDIVWERFQRATMSAAIRQQAQYNMKQHKREHHIPLHPDRQIISPDRQ
ncbi:MAG: GSCFA domain-containing protein [Bacteroidales bacterium]|nr:GSCFA domain-containing protein [Bacteroidales bacterium]